MRSEVSVIRDSRRGEGSVATRPDPVSRNKPTGLLIIQVGLCM
jgi:hypothetical protein